MFSLIRALPSAKENLTQLYLKLSSLDEHEGGTLVNSFWGWRSEEDGLCVNSIEVKCILFPASLSPNDAGILIRMTYVSSYFIWRLTLKVYINHRPNYFPQSLRHEYRVPPWTLQGCKSNILTFPSQMRQWFKKWLGAPFSSQQVWHSVADSN